MGVKYSANESFFDHWSKPMAYVLGYLYADGSLEDSPNIRGKYMRVSSTDRERIVLIRKLLSSKHTIVEKKPSYKNGKLIYLLRIGSTKIYNKLTDYGLCPNKSLTIPFPINIPEKYFSDFVRGYFDGDGCVFFEKANGVKGKMVKRISVIFTSGSYKFLDGLREALYVNNKIIKCNICSGKTAYQLRYNTNSSIRIFKIMYNNARNDEFLARKLNIFLDYFKRRPKRTDPEVRKIFGKLGIKMA